MGVLIEKPREIITKTRNAILHLFCIMGRLFYLQTWVPGEPVILFFSRPIAKVKIWSGYKKFSAQ